MGKSDSARPSATRISEKNAAATTYGRELREGGSEPAETEWLIMFYKLVMKYINITILILKYEYRELYTGKNYLLANQFLYPNPKGRKLILTSSSSPALAGSVLRSL